MKNRPIILTREERLIAMLRNVNAWLKYRLDKIDSESQERSSK